MAKKAADDGQAFLGRDRFRAAGCLSAHAAALGRFRADRSDRLCGLWAHVQKVAQLPGVARAIERERLQLNLYKAA
jgi:glutathione S-transferase